MSNFLQNMAVLNVAGLSAGYDGRFVLKEVALRINDGEGVALIGPNGCGKSTLLRTIAGLVPTDSGEVLLEGVTLCNKSTDCRVHQGVGYLKQTNNIFAGLTVEDNLELSGRSIQSAYLTRQRIDRICSFFPALTDRLKTRAGLLSGGQKKSLAVAMVLMHPIRLLLLDEPVAGLSPQLGDELLQAVRCIQGSEGFSMIIVEHALRMIHPHVSRLLVMREGAIIDDTKDTNRLLDASWIAGHYQIRNRSMI
jgi:ABC-type branched-subunit amino acid transport system ATPase component